MVVVAVSVPSMQVILVPFRLWVTAGISNSEISGEAPSAEIRENINTTEFFSTISSSVVVVERVLVILLGAPITVKFHVKVVLVATLHVTSSLSPT